MAFVGAIVANVTQTPIFFGKPWFKNQMVDYWVKWDNAWIKPLVAEFMATFLFLYNVLIIVAHVTLEEWDAGPALLTIAIGCGFSLTTICYVFARESGSFVNPAIAAAFVVNGQIPFVKGVLYAALEFVAGILAAVCVELTMPDPGYAKATVINTSHITWLGVFAIEFFLTFFFLTVVFGAALDPNEQAKIIGPLAIGLSLTSLILAGATTSGACLNPARALGPSFVSNHYSINFWAQIFGPTCGGMAGGAVYNLIFLHEIKKPVPEAGLVTNAAPTGVSAPPTTSTDWNRGANDSDEDIPRPK